MQPQYAVVCAGCGVFGGTVLPDVSVIQRYEAAGATILRTDKDDAGISETQTGGDDNIVMRTAGKVVSMD